VRGNQYDTCFVCQQNHKSPCEFAHEGVLLVLFSQMEGVYDSEMNLLANALTIKNSTQQLISHGDEVAV